MIDVEKIDPLELRMMYEYMRANAHDIRYLGNQGDKEAIIVEANYRALYADQLNVHKQNEFIVSVKAFMKRDLTIATREILQNRFGYKPPR